MSRRAEKAAPPKPRASQRRAALLVCGLLLLAVWFVFAQTIDFGFVNYDDEMNLSGNPAIRQGLSAEGIRWARTTTHGSQWAPVTWISYLADYQLYGLKPHGYHLTNVLLHSATTVLLFLVLWRMTGRLWPCAFVAAVFAVHPLHVETVAWLSERKGLLSGLFFVLTLGAYVEYARRRPLHVRSLAYLAMLVFFALGLMSKPILVTLPFVLLLLDYWPLRRMSHLGGADIPVCQEKPQSGGRQECLPHQTVWRLIAEKLPLLLLSIVSCAIAPWAQGKAVIALEKIPLPARIGNALVSYVDYLGETLWPTDLAVFYPHPLNTLPTWKPIVALLVLLGITAAVLVRWRRNPYLPVGWFWYVGMLVPAIGLVQIGVHAMADRYMYLPQIGLCLALTWSVLDLVRSWPNRTLVCATMASLLVIVLAACAAQQTTYWRDSESLWTHAIACTPPSTLALTNLGGALADGGQFDKAIEQYQAALAIDPKDAKGYSLLGDALLHLRRADEAIGQYEKSVRIQPNSAETQSNYAAALNHQKRFKEAAAHCEKALQIEPNYVEAHSNLGNALAHLGQFDEAIDHYETALRISPDRSEIRHNLDVVRAIKARQEAKQGLQGEGR
ncbi:MAG: tetratricopeptide repeat protein [Thermoguttaceae bacterium]|jgi:tetratricopeptide (TPR) repeat protein